MSDQDTTLASLAGSLSIKMPIRPKKNPTVEDADEKAPQAQVDTVMKEDSPEDPAAVEGATDPEAQVQFPEELSSAFDVQNIRILPGSTDKAASFEIEGEDHTLGNALRYIIMKNPQVEFCGYTIPHPSEAKMNLRIQTYEDEDYTAAQALEKGLNDLIDLCDVVADRFVEARNEHRAEHAADESSS